MERLDGARLQLQGGYRLYLSPFMLKKPLPRHKEGMVLPWGVTGKLQAAQSISSPQQQTLVTISTLLMHTKQAGLDSCLGTTQLGSLRITAAVAKTAHHSFC